MNVVGWKESRLSDKIIATIKCERCSSQFDVMCDGLSQIKRAVCFQCGAVNLAYVAPIKKDNKSIKSEVKRSEDTESVKVSDRGLSRIKRIYNSIKRKDRVDEEVFKDCESFVRWSIDNGYRDWKKLCIGPSGLLSSDAVWVVTPVGATERSYKDKVESVANDNEALGLLAKASNMSLEHIASEIESVDKLSRTLQRYTNGNGEVSKTVKKILALKSTVRALQAEIEEW